MPSKLLLLGLLSLAACGSSRQATLNVQAADTLLTLSDGQGRTTVPLTDLINSSGGYRHQVLDVRRGSDGRSYLLLRTTGQSRAQGGEERCGAGEETDVVWMAVDPGPRVAKSQAVTVASCLRMREPVVASTDPWSFAFHIPGDSVTTATYDRDAPERGIQLSTTPE